MHENAINQQAETSATLTAVDKSDLAGMISVAENRAKTAEGTAERFEALLAGLIGEPPGVAGGTEPPARVGIYKLTDMLDRTDNALNRINVCSDRLQSLASL